MNKNPIFLLTAIFVFALAGTGYGHGLGQTVVKTVGDYHVDLEYESLELRAQEPVRMNFNIRWVDPAHKADLIFTDVWVRIIEANTGGGFDPTVFAGPISQANFGPTGMTYVFPRGGTYQVEVRFENEDKTIAESSFELTVTNAPQPANAITAGFGGLVGLLIGALGVYVVMRKRV